MILLLFVNQLIKFFVSKNHKQIYEKKMHTPPPKKKKIDRDEQKERQTDLHTDA